MRYWNMPMSDTDRKLKEGWDMGTFKKSVQSIIKDLNSPIKTIYPKREILISCMWDRL